ncbi:MAG: MAPEG family protein, partial [Rhizobiaceae bacterium]|nr:MAPEG family protein [Rhizobiaceae bacterium]
VSLGDGGEDILSRRIRAQGNLAEYAPMGLFLIFLAEYQGALTWIVSLCAAIFVIGRLSHGYALSFKAHASGARIRGMVMTFVGLALLTIVNLWMVVTVAVG